MIHHEIKADVFYIHTHSHCHAIIFPDGTATSQERDNEDNGSQTDGHNGNHGLSIVRELGDGSKVGEQDGTKSDQQNTAYLKGNTLITIIYKWRTF